MLANPALNANPIELRPRSVCLDEPALVLWPRRVRASREWSQLPISGDNHKRRPDAVFC